MRHAELAPARLFGPAVLLVAGLAFGPVPARAAQADDHAATLAALHDLRAAISEIVQADASNSTDRNVYHRAGQRAINALEGAHGGHYTVAAGTLGDVEGAIGHIDKLLDRAQTPVWADPLRGAEANMRAAVTHLQDASRARELMDYQIAVTRALTYLEVAEGRPNETGVLGGLEGALANTVLGVPGDARQADACAAPPSAPAYGVEDGYIGWVSVPAKSGTYTLPENPGGTQVAVQNGMVVLRTAAAPIVAKSCATRTASVQSQPAPQSDAPPAGQAAEQTTTQPAQPAASGGSSSSLPALYTEAQAKTGETIFDSKCVSCHGANLQGTAAPSVAGNDFLKTAKQNGWTVAIIRYLVFNLMPMNAAKSLTPEQYANVMAFLLASNCYPAGSTPFPTANKPDLADVKLGPVPGHPPNQNKLGVCKVG